MLAAAASNGHSLHAAELGGGDDAEGLGEAVVLYCAICGSCGSRAPFQVRALDKRVHAAKRSLAAREKERLKAEQALEEARVAVTAAGAAVEGAKKELADREA